MCYNKLVKKIPKQSKPDLQHSAKAKKEWMKRLKEQKGINAKEFGINFTWEKMYHIAGELWTQIIDYGKNNNVEVKNVVAIMAKDTRKTTVFVIFLWFLMNEYPWINGFLLRDTIEKSKTQMKMQLRKAVNFITHEFGVSDFYDNAKESTDGFYLVRDAKRKDNQKVELLSFDSAVEVGGFTTSNGNSGIFIYDELQNPNSSDKPVQSVETFFANYKQIANKNANIELTNPDRLPDYIPRHIFLSNRYIAEHPLNLFAEEHFPFYDQINDDDSVIKGAKSWMIDDPLNNNFIVKYIDDNNVKEGWEEFSKTLIIYGSTFSNFLLRASKMWEEQALKAVRGGKQEDLAYYIGDLYEGYDDREKAYHYTRIDKINREQFENDYAPFVDIITIALDLDFSDKRGIIIKPKYHCAKGKAIGRYDTEMIYRTIREKTYKVKCSGVSKDGAKTYEYFQQTWEKIKEICEYTKRVMPHIKRVDLLFDDKKAQWVSQFNYGEAKNDYWFAQKVNFDQTWRIFQRPAVIDRMQDEGFLIDIEHPTNTYLHNYLNSVRIKESGSPKQRLEKARDAGVDIMNADEYGVHKVISRFYFNGQSKRKLGKNYEW